MFLVALIRVSFFVPIDWVHSTVRRLGPTLRDEL